MHSKFSIFFSVIFLVLTVLSLYGQSDYKVLSSSANQVTVQYIPHISKISKRTIGSEEYSYITLLEGGSEYQKPGEIETLSRLFTVGVPNIEGVSVEIISSVYDESTGVLPPVAAIKKSGAMQIDEYKPGPIYAVQKYFPENLAVISNSGSIRNMPVVDVKVNPIQCNPVERKIRIYKNITFKVTFRDGINNLGSTREDNLLKDAVINYQAAKQFIKSSNSGLQKIAPTSSVLSTGKWVRFEIPEEGIYKITYSMLNSFGIDAAAVDPRTIKIYCNGAKPLSDSVTAARINDLQEIPVYISGESDGKFDNSDYIIFYAANTNYWEYDSLNKKYGRYTNNYSNVNYCWITAGGSQGKRMENEDPVNSTNPTVTESTSAFAYWDVDKVNIGKSGRDFFGDEFLQSVTSRTYLTKLEGRIQGSAVQYKYRFANASSAGAKLDIEESGQLLLSHIVDGYGYDPNTYTIAIADTSSFNYAGSLPDNNSSLRFTFHTNDPSTHGYLDYFEITYLRDLKPLQDNLIFYSPLLNGSAEYHLSNFSSSDIKVFSISDLANVRMIANPTLWSGSEFQFQGSTVANMSYKYAAVGATGYKTPKNPVQMPNQNLHGESNGAEYVIITPNEFYEQANRLAIYRSTTAKVPVSTMVVKIDDIYNEFSGGKRDVSALRDYLRYAFKNWKVRPSSVLMFGHGDYDYRNIEGFNNNYLFPYESVESLQEINSYNTDDYFVRVDGEDLYIDLAIGRIPVRNAAEAANAVDKIIAYETKSDISSWRNLITLVADDGWTSQGFEGSEHTDRSEELSSNIPQSFDQKKIYLADYPTLITSFGRRKPEVNDAIIRAVNEGTLLLNYYGHGSPDLWAHEQVFVKDITIPSFNNNNYFFLTAATCDFGYFDRPNAVSATEDLLSKENGGAIGVLSATRPVYSGQNSAINNAFYSKLLQLQRDTMNLPFPIGRLYFYAKKNMNQVNDLKYHLFCDPMLRLNLGQLSGSIDLINGKSSAIEARISALSRVVVKGKIQKANSAYIDTNYTGEGILTVYDSQQLRSLAEFSEYSSYTYNLQGGIIFRGRISINAGVFSADFIVPKDISYENRNGKMVLYFFNKNSDGIVFSNNIVIGGTDTTAVNDGAGPIIKVAFDNPESTDAYLVKPNSTLYVLISDQTGINATGTGLGRQMRGILDGNEASPIDFTNYFNGDINSGGKTGKVIYKFDNLSAGKHTLKIQASDVFNNISSQFVTFNVSSDAGLLVENVYNYPNPFSGSTMFMADINDSPVQVKINIYSPSGRLLHRIERANIPERNIKIPWDGKDKEGNLVANGVYLYKFIVSSLSGAGTRNLTGKFAIVR